MESQACPSDLSAVVVELTSQREATAAQSSTCPSGGEKRRQRVLVCGFYERCAAARPVFFYVNVLDGFSREALVVEVDTNLPAARIIRVFDRIAAWRAYPTKIRMTMARSLSRYNLPDRLSSTGSTLSSYNQKTHMWSGSTVSSAKRCQTTMFLVD